MRRQLLLSVLIAFLLNLSSNAQTLIDPAGDGGFETGATFAANGWTVANGSTNQWYVGNPTGLGATGARAAFISDNGGTAHSYSNTTTVSHFYRDITIPANTQANLSFRWRSQGEANYDDLRVFLVLTTTTPTGGTQLTSGQVGGDFRSQSNWQTVTNLFLFCNTTGSPVTRRLVFSWRNDASVRNNPPAAVDDISVVASPIPACNLGTGVTNVAALPYNSGAGTTCGQVNDLTSSNTVACGSSSYLGGEDAVWVFTAPSSGAITIDLTSSGSWTGLMVYNGCPVTCSPTPGTCIAQAQSSSGDKSLCFNATAGVTYYVVLDVFPSPNCNAYTNLSISAPVASPNSCTLAGTYTMSSIPHNPDVLTSPNLSGFTDDIFYPGGNINTGFDFCLNGNQYQNFLISANGYVIFATPDCSVTNLPGGSNATPGGYSGWSITANIPNTNNAPRNAILAPWHDIDPSITSNGANPRIRYQVFGTAPNRRFVVSWENVPMFSSSCNGDRTLDFTGQIKMFETTNDIEIHVTRKRVCPSWNNGRAILGLHNYNGTQALVPANRNALDPSWTATNEAYRFTFNPTACTTCSPLPLNLMFFTGSWDKQRLEAHLQWAFKDQKDVMYYILEHSTDEKNFKEIAQIPVKSENFYTFAHTNPAKGRNFYRLQKVSKNQSTEKSHYVTVVNPIAEVWQIENVYPNPTNMQAINLDINSLENQELILKLINLQGVQVSEQKYMLEKGHNSIYFEMKQAPKGTYLLVCQTPTQIETRKIVVE